MNLICLYYIFFVFSVKETTSKLYYVAVFCLVVSIVGLVLIVVITPTTLITNDKCTGSRSSVTDYAGDFVLATKITPCQTNTTLTPTGVPSNKIDVYSLSCDDLQSDSEHIEHTFPEYDNVTSAIQVISEEQDSGSNYYTENTKAEIISTIGAKNEIVYICRFTNFTVFDSFMHPEDSVQFFEAVDSGICVVLENVSDITYNMTFTVNETDSGYHFAAIAPQPGHVLDSLKVKVTVDRKFYNLSHLDDHHVCSLSNIASMCKITNIRNSDTCIVLHTTFKDDDNDFSYINIKSDKTPLIKQHTVLPKVICTSVITFILVITLIIATAVLLRRYQCLNRDIIRPVI